MKISLIRLAEGLHTLDFVEKLAEFGLEGDPKLCGDVQIRVDLEKRAPHYFLKNHVQASGRFACDRCANEFDLTFQGDSRSVFSSDEAMLAMNNDDEVHFIAPDAKELDITSDIRDTLLLAIPSKLLCKEDCRGLCAGCGVNLNEEACRCAGSSSADPRWEALRKLL